MAPGQELPFSAFFSSHTRTSKEEKKVGQKVSESREIISSEALPSIASSHDLSKLPGNTLWRMLEEGQEFSWEMIYRIALDIATALKTLHHSGKIHGQLTSESILYKDSHAEFRQLSVTDNKQYNIVATPPESNPPSAKTDIYHFGWLLWQMVMGQTISAAIEKVKHGEKQEIPRYCPDVLTEMIRSCWQVQPEDRPTADKLVKQLGSSFFFTWDLLYLSKENILKNIVFVPEEDLLILGILGYGSKHLFYDCLWKQNNEFKIVAVKEPFRPTYCDDKLFMEAKVMWQMGKKNSDYIVQSFGFIRPQRVVIECIPNGTLSGLLRSGETLSWNTLCQIALDVAHGIKLLHQLSVVYANVKSSKVLLYRRDNVLRAKIEGFDYALAALTLQKKYEVDGLSQTKRWNSPEMQAGATTITTAYDMYHFGWLLCEIASRHIKPFVGVKNRSESKAWIEEKNIIPDCPPQWKEMIKACWDASPSKRPKIEELITSLRLLMDSTVLQNLVSTPVGEVEAKASPALASMDPSFFSISSAGLTISTTILGKGTFGIVYKGKYNTEDVAIKHTNNKKGLRSLMKEAKFLSQLKNPYFVKLIKVMIGEEPYGLVMELMSHGSLHNVLSNGAVLSKDIFKQIIMDIAHGLKILHERGIIHADIKSHNILINASFRAKIGDLGSAMLVEQKGQLLGTVRWVAPEIFRGKITTSSDIHSFGWLVWEMLTYSLPYVDLHHSLEIMSAILQGIRGEFPPNCPLPLKEFIMSCWDPSPIKRPSSLVLPDLVQALPLKDSPETPIPLADFSTSPASDIKSSQPTSSNMSRKGEKKSSLFSNAYILTSLPKEIINLQDQLVWACRQGNENLVNELLIKGAKADERDAEGQHPLAAAIWGMSPNIVKRLITLTKEKASLNIGACWEHNQKYYKAKYILTSEMPTTYREWVSLIRLMESSQLLMSLHLENGFENTCLLMTFSKNENLKMEDCWPSWDQFKEWLYRRRDIEGPDTAINLLEKNFLTNLWKLSEKIQNNIKDYICAHSNEDKLSPIKHEEVLNREINSIAEATLSSASMRK